LKRSICPISTKYFSLSLSLSLSSSLCTHTRIHTRIHTAKSHAEKSKVDYESQLQESADEINRYTLKYIHVYIYVCRHAVCLHSMHVYALTITHTQTVSNVWFVCAHVRVQAASTRSQNAGRNKKLRAPSSSRTGDVG
jgi:hypothetical protein